MFKFWWKSFSVQLNITGSYGVMVSWTLDRCVGIVHTSGRNRLLQPYQSTTPVYHTTLPYHSTIYNHTSLPYTTTPVYHVSLPYATISVYHTSLPRQSTIGLPYTTTPVYHQSIVRCEIEYNVDNITVHVVQRKQFFEIL